MREYLPLIRRVAWPRPFIASGLCVLAAGSPARAADGATPETLDEIVITGTRTERSQGDTPVRTEVVSRQELERTHARTLTEALANVPGLLLRPVHGKAGYEASLQGLSGEQVLVLVDGLPVSPSTGSTVDLSQLALTEVERVEIVKGALSAQYGSAAMGGVINVITRSVRPGFSGEVLGDLGSYGEQNPSGDESDAGNRHGRARLEGGTEQLRLRLAADGRHSDGFDPDPSSWPQPGDAVDRSQLDGRVEWHPAGAGRLYLGGSSFEEDADSRFLLQLPGQSVEQSKRESVERRRLTAGGRWEWTSGWRAQINGVGEIFRDDTLKFAGATSFDDRKSEQVLNHVTLQLDAPALAGERLTQLWQLGLEYHDESLEQTKDGSSELEVPGSVRRDSREIFLQDDIFIGEHWELLPGLRYQDDSDFGGHAAPKVSLRGPLWEVGRWSGRLRAGWGAGYRVPNLKERYYRFDHSQLGYVVIGNPDLEPEESSSWQLGWAGSWGEDLSLDFNLFRNALDNLIQVDEANAPVVNGIRQFSYANIRRARTQGAELAAVWHAGPALSFNAAYTFLDTRDEATGDDLTRQPQHQGHVGASWRALPQAELNLRARAQGSELVSTTSGARSPGWATLDLFAHYDLNAAWRVFGGIENLFDEQRDFRDPDDFGPLAGTFVYLGLRFAWDRS